METIIATLPTSVQTQIKTLRETYKTKEEALRTEEETQLNTILASYPDAQKKLTALKKTRPGGFRENNRHGGSDSER